MQASLSIVFVLKRKNRTTRHAAINNTSKSLKKEKKNYFRSWENRKQNNCRKSQIIINNRGATIFVRIFRN